MIDPVTPNAPDSIRRATPDDAETLSRLGRETFIETWVEGYRMPYAPDAVAEHIEATFGMAAIAARLIDPAQAYWVAERDARAIGYALAGPCTLPYPEAAPDDGELKHLYLRRAAQTGGLGGRLLDRTLAWLERDGPRRIWLGVWSGNTAAQRFYARRGFTKFGEHTYPVGDVIDREFAMLRG
jgi:ribosomal protein S18 acetylase RimI-like enzyme